MVTIMRKIASLLILILTVFLTSCNPTSNRTKLVESNIDYFQYFDTLIYLRVWDTKKYNSDSELWKGAEDIIKHIQLTFQKTKDGDFEPELYKLNQSAGSGQPFKVSDDLFEVLKLGLEFAELTDGKFDPTIGPLVDLWDINNKAGKDAAPPSQEEIEAILPLIDYRLVELDEENKTVLLPLKGMAIDLGAIAKGYAADVLADYFKANGIEHAIINLGGNIFAIGKRYEKRFDGREEWAIGIRDPRFSAEDSIANVYIVDKTIVTSGTYERFFRDINDTSKTYHHILNPDTGYPYDNNISSVTIICDSSALADALSTSLFALGIENGIKFLEGQFPDVAAVFIDNDMNFYKTSNIDELYDFEPFI